MIYYTKGNIIQADVEALVNTVNTVGVMGKGIALAFKKAFPENYKIYRKQCENNEFHIGKLLITETGQLRPKYIINFPTKKHWRNKSEMEYIELGMKELVRQINKKQIQSIAIPPLGCGNGGLNWDEVKPVILRELKSLDNDIDIHIYEPGYNNQDLNKPTKKIGLTPARAMLLTLLKNYQILGYSINLLVIQKMAYFLQRFGEPVNLDYKKGYYGPYSHRLQHLLNYLNGYFLAFEPGSTNPGTVVQLQNLEEVEKYNKTHLTAGQKIRLEKVKHLIEGFESPFGLELLATVDFIIKEKALHDTGEIIKQIGNWTKRKKALMKPFHIQVAHQRLKENFS